MAYQGGSNIVVAFEAQSALGTPASGAGGTGFRLRRGSQGLRLQKAIIESQEVRGDGQTRKGRHGSRMVTGSYAAEMSVDTHDDLLAAALRSSWTASAVRTYDAGAALTSLAISGSGATITQVGTTTLIGAVYKGDKIKLANMSTAANNDKWVRVLNVTATVLTVEGGVLTDQAADSACTMTIARRLISGTTPTESYFTFDEHYQDIDRSITYTDVKVNRIEISAQPNEHVVVTYGLMGLDAASNATGASPVLTSPTYTTTIPLVLADGKVMINDTDYADVTGFSFVYDLGGAVPGVLAPNPPDVFLGNAKCSGSLSVLRTDLDWFDAFDNETSISFFVDMRESGDSDPEDYVSLYVGNAVFDGNEASLGDEGPIVETIPWRAGKDEAGSASASTTVLFSTSAS